MVSTTALLVVGFATLLLSGLPLIRLFGALCCLALVVALVGDLVFLPALLLVAERRWWRARRGRPPALRRALGRGSRDVR
jgi:predicted RND superfamily exporter protein